MTLPGASRLGPGREFRLIEAALSDAEPTRPEVVVGWGDDAAVIKTGTLAVSTDLSVEGVHFRREWMSVEEIGYRAASAALSDMAAMAAEPIGVLLSVAIAPEAAESDFSGIVAGVREAARGRGANLVGGDLSRTREGGALVVDVVCLGSVPESAVRRSGGRPGDEVWVTGVLGGAATAVASWLTGTQPSAAARRAFLRPTPRVQEARWLQERGVLHALIDVSDGLGGDLAHLAVASHIDIEIDSSLVPRFDGEAGGAPLSAGDPALDGGEDYELCFLAPPGQETLKDEFSGRFGVPLTRIGRAVPGSGELRIDGSPYESRAFDHFSRGRRRD